MRKKRLRQEQDHQQKSKPEQNFPRDMKPADLQRQLKLGYCWSHDVSASGEQEPAKKIQRPLQSQRELRRFKRSFQGKIKERFQPVRTRCLRAGLGNIQSFIAAQKLI